MSGLEFLLVIGFGAFIIVFFFVWIFLPFAVFGIKPSIYDVGRDIQHNNIELKKIVAELKIQNELLRNNLSKEENTKEGA